MDYIRPYADDLVRRLAEPRRFIQVVTGPRQAGRLRSGGGHWLLVGCCFSYFTIRGGTMPPADF